MLMFIVSTAGTANPWHFIRHHSYFIKYFHFYINFVIHGSPHQLNLNHNIETIQNQFLRFVSFNFNIYRVPHSMYVHLLNYLNLDSRNINTS
jgi:hypothetical protein